MSEAAQLPLSGVRVLDLGRFVAAPFVTQMLGDLGAEIIKIERPIKGDDLRNYGPPFLKDKDGKDALSFDYLASNRNKKSVTVDISMPEGGELIKTLAKVSDVFIENFKAGHLRRFNLAYDDISAVNPDIVYCSISGFGQTGPYAFRPALDSIFQATSGLMSITGDADGPPTKVGTVVCDITAGLYSTVGILAALRHKEVNGGGGQHLDMSALETAMAALLARAQVYLCTGEAPKRTGSTTPGNAPAGMFHCKDGELIISAGSDEHFRILCRTFGEEHMADDPRFVSRGPRVINQAALTAWMESHLMKETRAHWLGLLQSTGVMCAPINSIAEAFNDPHVQHRGMVNEVDIPNVGKVPLVANPIRFSKTKIPTPKPPPSLGQHTDEVLTGVANMTADEIQGLRDRGTI
jgi:crotonobetainyl-CoA:carnitine CoA-transferase CaiB-like acyl-CoA transferase